MATTRIPAAELERRLIEARDSFDRQITDLEADIAHHGLTGDRLQRLERLLDARERCERMILAKYPEG